MNQFYGGEADTEEDAVTDRWTIHLADERECTVAVECRMTPEQMRRFQKRRTNPAEAMRNALRDLFGV